MLLTLAVAQPTPHDYSGTFQGGHSAGLAASKWALREQEGSSTKKTLICFSGQCCVHTVRAHHDYNIT